MTCSSCGALGWSAHPQLTAKQLASAASRLVSIDQPLQPLFRVSCINFNRRPHLQGVFIYSYTLAIHNSHNSRTDSRTDTLMFIGLAHPIKSSCGVSAIWLFPVTIQSLSHALSHSESNINHPDISIRYGKKD